MFWLGNEHGSFCVFEIACKYCLSESFVDYDGHSTSSKGFLPTVADIMVDGQVMRTYYIAQGTLLNLCGDLNGKAIQKRGAICIPIADSLCNTAGTNTNCKATILQF